MYNILNVHGVVCGNLGPRQKIDSFGPPDYLPLKDYTFKATPLTSYHYPTAVLACHLQLISKHNGNGEDCVSHPCNGPFRVVYLEDRTLCLVNSRQEQVCLLPFPKALDNKLRPWQYRGDRKSNCNSTSSNPQSPNANASMGTDTSKNDTDVEMSEASSDNDNSSAPDSSSPSMFSGNSNQKSNSPSNQVKRQGTLNFGQTPLSTKQPAGSPNGSASAPVFGPAVPPPSTLKQSSYAQAPHNEVIPIVHPPENLMIGLGDVPTNKSGVPVLVLFSVPPVDSQHPCDFFHGGTITMLQVVSRFDITFVLCPLRRKDGKLPNIPAAIPKAYPPSYEHLVPYIDVPNGDQLKLAVGVIRYGKNKGQKRKQQQIYSTLCINSEVCPRYLVDVLSPMLDKRQLSLSVKPLQMIRTVTFWAIVGVSPDLDVDELLKLVVKFLEEELASCIACGKLKLIDVVPEFALTVKPLRLPNANQRTANASSGVNLEHYASQLRRAYHVEVSEFDVGEMDELVAAVESSKIFKSFISRKAHVLPLARKNALHGFLKDSERKIEAHMAYVAGVSSTECAEIVDIHGKFQVAMAPLEDGSVPPVPYKYSSLYRELTSILDSNGFPMIDTLCPISSGPNAGLTTIVFRQNSEAEELVLSFARSPCAWLFHFLLNEKGYREDSCLHAAKAGFDVVSRGKLSSTSWCRTPGRLPLLSCALKTLLQRRLLQKALRSLRT
jgi:hypothetical protein